MGFDSGFKGLNSFRYSQDRIPTSRGPRIWWR